MSTATPTTAALILTIRACIPFVVRAAQGTGPKAEKARVVLKMIREITPDEEPSDPKAAHKATVALAVVQLRRGIAPGFVRDDLMGAIMRYGATVGQAKHRADRAVADARRELGWDSPRRVP